MKNLNLLDVKNPLLLLSNNHQQAIQCIAEGLCLSQSINTQGKELIMHFGYLSDSTNLTAISTWVYDQVLKSNENSQSKLIEKIKDEFEEAIQNICYEM